MLAIRLRRLGSKKRPFFRVVVIDSHAARDGRSVEVLGYYNPTSQPETLELKRERLEHWLSRGAQLSDTVRTLLRRNPAEAPLAEAPPAEAPLAETPLAQAQTAEASTGEAAAESPS